MSAPNFNLKSEFNTIHRRPFELDDVDILDPNNVRPIVDGEWLQLTTTTYKMARGGNNAGNLTDEGTVPAFVYFAERGRYETQALGKGPFLYMGVYEADTKIMDATGLAVGDVVSIFDVDIGGIIRRGLGERTAAGVAVGFVTRLPANNNSFLRFIHDGFGRVEI